MITESSKTFKEITKHDLNDMSFIRMFNILIDNDTYTKFLNIFRSYTFNDNVLYNVTYFDTHEVSNDEWWDNISNKYYGSPYLWWLVASFNGVLNPFEELEEGTNLKVLKANYVYNVLRDLDSIASF